jgi:hypothetical protein
VEIGVQVNCAENFGGIMDHRDVRRGNVRFITRIITPEPKSSDLPPDLFELMRAGYEREGSASARWGRRIIVVDAGDAGPA